MTLYVFIDYDVDEPIMLFTCLQQLEKHLKIAYHVYVIVQSELSTVHKTLQTLTNCKYINKHTLQKVIAFVDSRNDYKMFINYCTMLTKDITILSPCYIYTNKLEYICRKGDKPCGYLYDKVNTQNFLEFLKSPKDGYTNYHL